MSKKQIGRLVVVSHTPHYRRGDAYVGWGATVRELDYLAQLCDQLVHVAILYPGKARGSALPYSAENVTLRLLPPAGGERWQDKLGILTQLPAYWLAINQELNSADAVHVRCPANISLTALIGLTFRRTPRPRWFKFAGHWRPPAVDFRGYEAQRFWLRRNLARGVVTVNGRWPQQRDHVRSFFNPSLTANELAEGRIVAAQKQLTLPLRLLFVGRTEAAKGVGPTLKIVAELGRCGIPATLDLIGDGPERPMYEERAEQLGIREQVTFHGWLPRGDLSVFYANAHFLLLLSASEGWPKVVSEAMAFGTPSLTSDVSSLPQILHQTGAGLALPVQGDNVDAFVTQLVDICQNRDRYQQLSEASVTAAAQFSYENYQGAVQQLFTD